MAKAPLINIDADLDDADWPKRRPVGMPPRKAIGLVMDPSGVPLFRTQQYNPAQPRTPAGTPAGGQWVGGIGGLFATIGQPDGGFTYSPVTGDSPTSGFAVSVHQDRSVVLDREDVTLSALARFARNNRDLLRQPGKYLGGWHNPEDGKVYLDISTVVKDERMAQHLAREYHQIAYFNLDEGRSIPTPGEEMH